MDRLFIRFIYASLTYFIIGVLLGIVLVFWPKWPGLVKTAHVHISLMGWLSMAVYAAGYAAVPRLAGSPLYSVNLANSQFWLSNISIIAVSALWIIVAFVEPGTLMYAFFYAMLATSAVLMGLSAVLFAYNIIKTIKRKTR